MIGGRLGFFGKVGVFGWCLALGALAVACGADDGKKAVQACPEDCPAEQCDVATGTCLPAPASENGGAGGEPATSAGAPSGGAPDVATDTMAPTVAISTPHEGDVVGSSVTFDFEADEPASFTCTINDVPVKKCKPGITLDELDSGENTFTVMATDDAGNESEVVEVTFIVDRPPSIGDVAAIVTPEDVATGELPFTIDDPDSKLEDLVVTATLDSALPVPESGLILGGSGAERTVALTPAPNANGAAVLTLSVSDGFATTTRDVPVTVTPVNDPPTIEDVPNKRVAEHAVLGPVTFHVDDLETPANDLVVTAKSSDQVKVPNANIVLAGDGNERTVTITPVAQQAGPVTITLTVSDGELSATDTFVLTLGSTDDEPSISAIADQTTPEDTAKTVAFTVSDPDTNVNLLTPSASFDANGVVKSITFAGAGANRTLKVTPKANQTGQARITVTISDASGGVSTAFTLTVTPVNDPPTLKAPANQTIDEDSTTGALPFTVADVDSTTVTVTATSSDTTLIPDANVVVAPASSGPGSRNVTVTPAANKNGGPVTITLTASDGALTAKATFTVTVRPVNDLPTISDIADQLVEPDTSTGTLGFTVSDPDGDALTVTATSADTRVVPKAGISLGGNAAERNIALVPGANQGGSSLITVTVADGHGGAASDTFTLSVKVKIAGTVVGSGSVVASGTGCPGGGAICTAVPGAGTVTFVATPQAGAAFVNWTGACTGSGNGVVKPIPTAGVTCTAHFSNLWARLFYTPDDPQGQLATTPQGMVETPKALHYLAGEAYRATRTSVIWNADILTGAVIPNTSFVITRDGTPLLPVDLMADTTTADGTVALINDAPELGAGLLWLDPNNKLVRALSYQADDGVTEHVPYGLVRSKDGGIAFTETSHNTSVGAVFPTLAQLTRVDATGNVLEATQFHESLSSCAQSSTGPSYLPVAVAQNSAGQYLVAGAVPPVDGSSLRMNLTLFDATGVPIWGRHFEAEDRALVVVPEGVTASGTTFFVSGIIGDAKRSFDGFGLSITNGGVVNWWRSFGADGTQEVATRSVLRGSDYVLTGWSAQQGSLDLMAMTWKADGSLASGLVYGAGGGEQGIYISTAASGGYNLFGTSTNSFGNTVASTWALRVDKDLQILLQTGAVSAYEPALTDQGTSHVQATCVDQTTYVKLTPAAHDLNANPSPVTVGGAYQATP